MKVLAQVLYEVEQTWLFFWNWLWTVLIGKEYVSLQLFGNFLRIAVLWSDIHYGKRVFVTFGLWRCGAGFSFMWYDRALLEQK